MKRDGDWPGVPKDQQPRRKRGPVPTGKGHPIQVRLQPPALRDLDAWRATHLEPPTRPEAIRAILAAYFVERDK